MSIVYLSLIGFLTVGCQIVAWRLRLPAILFLLLAGIVVGPAFSILNPDELFGDLLMPVTSLAVAIILFEGSLSLRFCELKGGLGRPVGTLLLGGVLISWAGISLAAFYSTNFHWETAVLFGAIMVVSGPTVIKPLLQAVQPVNNVAKPLYWESIILDPLAGLLAALVVGFIVSNHDAAAVQQTVLDFFTMIGLGCVFGLLNGYLLSEIVKRHWLPNILENILVLNWVIIAFVASNYLVGETGLITVTLMGLVMANRKEVPLETILDFKETISTLLLSGLFIVLAARIEFNHIHEIIPESLMIFLLMQFVVQPLKVSVATWGSQLNWKERFLISWIAPRGIIAAALVSIFAIKLHQLGYPQAEALVPITFMIIIYSVIWPSLTARPLARLLHLRLPEANGVLIVGANQAAREIAKALMRHNINVLVADSSWENISAARLNHIPVYFGNPTSDNADRNLDLTGIGVLFAVTPNNELSNSARMKFRTVLGKNAIYYVKTHGEKKVSERHLIAQHNRGKELFTTPLTYQQLASYFSQGAEIKSTVLTDTFTYDEYKKNNTNYLPLFLINKKQQLVIHFSQSDIEPGTTIVSLAKKS